MKRQRGYVAAIFLVLLIMGFLGALVGRLSAVDSGVLAERDLKNAAVLREARGALLAWAAHHPQNPGNRTSAPCQPVDTAGPFCPDSPGALPCPDRNNDGWADEPCNLANQQTGRFPWRTLNAPDLRDDAGERLWYAVSANFRHQTTYPAAFTVNAFTAGTLTVCVTATGCTGTQVIAAGLAAVVIAPRVALPGQNRTGANSNLLNHYLEGRNANPGVLFDSGPATATYNDSVLAISQTELMDAVVPIVADRARTSVAPAIRASYDPNNANSPRWQGMPYPVAFSDPRTATFDDTTSTTLPPPMEGLMPAHNASGGVAWVNGTAQFVSGAPTGSTLNCAIDGFGAYNCSLTLNVGTFPATVTVGALVRNVGRAFVLPYDTTAASVSLLSNVSAVNAVQHGAFGSSNVDADVRVQLTVLGNPAQFVLARPRLDPALTDPTLAFGAPTAWFTRNQWHRNVYYAVAPQNAGQTWATPCATLGCLQVMQQDLVTGATSPLNNLNGVLVLMGRSLVPLASPDNNPANYVELANQPAGGNHFQFVTGPARPNFNDRAVAAHP